MALMNALVGTARLNAFRLDYLTADVQRDRNLKLSITLDGAPLRIRLGSMTISDVINDAPNTCTFVVDHATPPTVGGRLRVVLGMDPPYVLFVGALQSAVRSYVGRPTVDVWQCEAIDDTQRADWLRPFGAWTGVSATTVAQQLVASFAPGFTAAYVQAGLAPVTVLLDGSERMNGALRLIAKLIGGYFYWEDYDLHLFVGDEPGASPDDIDGRPRQLLEDPPISYTRDDAQLRTRCYGKGHSEMTRAAVGANESRLPLDSTVMFPAGGGKALVESQRIDYTGTIAGGTGALVGPGVTPPTAPVLVSRDGSGIDPGAHSYGYTWVTAAGETIPSPLAAITVTGGTVAAPTFSVSQGVQFGGPPAGTVLTYAMCIGDGVQGGTYGAMSASLTITSNGNRPQFYFQTTADMRGRCVFFFRNDNVGTGWTPVPIQGNPAGNVTNPFPANQPTGYGQQWMDMLVSYSGGSPTPPGPNNGPLVSGRVGLSGVSVGPAAVTARKIYRSLANQTALKLLAVWADNTTTTGLDQLADSTLGAAPPASDTSGLQMTAGQVLPGATSLPISGSSWVAPGGGWAVIGNGEQVIRYAGLTGAALTGIPAAGLGAIVAAVNFNSTITGAPMLIGVTGLNLPVADGVAVALWVQCDNVDAQTALAARVGGSGIVEHLIVDARRGVPSLIALCNADLAQYSRPIETVQYTCFDPKSRSGRTVRIHLTQPPIDVSLVIQQVTIDQFAVGPVYPRFTVTASSIRTSLEDLLRRMVGTLEEGF